jgi:short-subunit dehydrogenase
MASKTALITGASSGIGESFARQCAARGYDLVLVARREVRLTALKHQLETAYPIQVTVLVADLSREEGIARVEQFIRDHAPLDLLVNNAGYNDTDDFVKVRLDTHLSMIKVMAETPMRLMYATLPGMIERQQGSIINVASMLGFYSVPYTASYGAVKSYLVSLSQAVALETWKQGIHISVLCPGFTHTEIFGTDGLDSSRRLPTWLWMEADEVVTAALHGVAQRQLIIVPGTINRLIYTLSTTRGVRWLLPFFFRVVYPAWRSRE